MDRERFLQQVAYLRERRCHPYGAALAYGPIVELLKQQFQIATSDRDEGWLHS